MVLYESSDVSQQAIVQNGNKGGDEKRTKGKEKIVCLYVGIMTLLFIFLIVLPRYISQAYWVACSPRLDFFCCTTVL